MEFRMVQGELGLLAERRKSNRVSGRTGKYERSLEESEG